jgi:hypothetical protein
VAAAQAVATAVANVLKHSTPKEGPLKDDDVWGVHLVDNFVRGITAGAPRVQAAMAQMLGGAGMGSIGVSHSFSGLSSPSAFMGSGGSPAIHIHNHPPANHFYLDGHELVQRLGPHLAYELQVQNANRRPV